MPIQKKYFSIPPANDQPLISAGDDSVTGGFSHRQGNPTIRFSIPAQDNLLEVNSLRLVGQFIVKTSNDNKYLGALAADTTNLDNNNGANLSRATSANMPNFGGIHNVIDKVIIQSKKTNTELSVEENYSMNASLMEAYRNSNADYAFGGVDSTNQSLAQGYNAESSNRRYNLSAGTKTGDGRDMGLGSTASKHIGQHFSIRLNVDMLQGGDLHLGKDFCNGLIIQLKLAPDSSFFHQRFRENAANQANAGIENIMYVLRNVRLEGRYIQPDKNDLANYQAVKLLSSKLNVINDVQSDDASYQYTPQLSNVRSFINLFLDDDQQNNLARQQNNFKNPLGLKEVEQSKDNLRYPLSYPVKVVPNVDSRSNNNNSISTLADVRAVTNKSDLVGDAEVRLHFERALLGKESSKNVNNLSNLNKALDQDYSDDGVDANNAGGNNMNPLMLGVGADYGYSVNNSLNMVNRDYGVNIKSGINSGLAKYPAMSNGKSAVVQTYIKHISALDTAKLIRTM